MRRGAKLGPLQVVTVLRELRRGHGDPRPLGVAGARELVHVLARELREGGDAADPLIAAESLRQALRALDRVTGRAGVEDMLDALFGRFCIGK